MISAVKNEDLPNTEMGNDRIMRSRACSPRGYRSAGVLRGEAAITEITISFLAVVLGKSSCSQFCGKVSLLT